MRNTHLVIGEITKPQGVRGELKLRPITCDFSRFEGLELAYLKPAERLRGELVYIDRAHAVELDEDSTFLCDLIGLHGVATDGRDLGTLKDVMQPGGNDVYVFRGPMGEVLVPALRSVVARVDLEAGEMLLDGARLDEVAVFDED